MSAHPVEAGSGDADTARQESSAGRASGLAAAVPAAQHALLRTALEHLPHGVCVFDADDRLVLANRRYIELWQLPPGLALPGTALAAILSAAPGCERSCGDAALADAVPRREWLRDDGQRIGMDLTRLPAGGRMALVEDLTGQRQVQAQVAHLSRHDELTGLPKRAALYEEFERLLARGTGAEDLALICLDLGRFKTVIDQFGHAAADQLLCEAAERLRGCTRRTDLIVRLGGDEFAVLQSGAEQPASAKALAQRMIAVLSRPFELAGGRAHLGASAGIAVAPFQGRDAETLLRQAGLALCQAKADARGGSRFFEPGMDAGAQARLSLEADLRQAVAERSLQLHYQPKIHLADGVVAGVEALLRWHHPKRGWVSPLDFIPVAEETGLILAIGRQVLAKACADARNWPSAVHVAVNVSPLQFRHGSLLRDVLAALKASGLEANRLEIEITETVMMEDTPRAVELLAQLRRHGVRVAMDDFGTGFSSLGLLRSFAFDRIKIDRSFVRDVDTHADARSIVRAIAGLGHSLGMAVTAEGVETAAQLDAVRREGCDEVQGFLFSPARPAGEIPGLLKTVVAAGLGRLAAD
ncbi:putative bifunctional diguanylate cyclase/phosphodiesterase [Rubrivivax gelatinosus]|uniref:Diguanylate cyclase (GGDEF)-like protein n=1 Tax=Rubrivivax gelatinosus TaxID=28068 RepID=A0ABS1DZJ2_RUBGE|nr:EAL domain-containing protein [Rubrivivax gelatinosus]MBK1715479.1 hypothetical protein [Rubrivivax gelatinosus]